MGSIPVGPQIFVVPSSCHVDQFTFHTRAHCRDLPNSQNNHKPDKFMTIVIENQEKIVRSPKRLRMFIKIRTQIQNIKKNKK